MQPRTTSVLIWLPRILGISYALFIGLFALDVFGESHGLWQTALALFMHLIPTFLVLAAVAGAWRWPVIGAVAFPALAIVYFVTMHGRFPWSTYAIMTGPLFLTGALFLISALIARQPPLDLDGKAG